jgi:2-polyprenyl-6-methoxyphenol hydroxylase-like FAD-dependent oxidoreductase
VTHAAAKHRALDAALAERLARDGGHSCGAAPMARGHGGALLPSRSRFRDLRTMNTTSNRRVLLTTLSARTSAKGNEYLSGYLAKAKVVAFKGEPDKVGNPTWDVYLSEPEPRDGATAPGQEAAR